MAEQNSTPLVTHLLNLAEREDRGALAALRGALRPGKELDALRIVGPFLRTQGRDGQPLSASARRRDEDDAMLLASLFALNPQRGSLSLASALLAVWRDSGSDSVEGRFRALLSASRGDLTPHLRHAVSLVASKGLSLDWDDLYRTLQRWDHEDERARRAWARDFWASAPAEAPQAPSTTTTI